MSKLNAKDVLALLDCACECGKVLVATGTALKEISEGLIKCGTTLEVTATKLKEVHSSIEEKKPALPNKAVPQPTQEVEQKYTLEEVRAILSEKSKAGFREQVREMLHKRGVDNLTKLDPSEYPSLVNEVEGLTNG